MTKHSVTSLSVGSLLAIFSGPILAFAAIWAAYANGALIMNGPDVTGIQSTFFAGAMVVLAIIGVLALVGGAIGQFVAWIGAVINTARLEDKTWFVVLLVLGLVSFGLVAMIAYVVAGPDGTVPTRVHGGIPARPLPVT